MLLLLMLMLLLLLHLCVFVWYNWLLMPIYVWGLSHLLLMRSYCYLLVFYWFSSLLPLLRFRLLHVQSCFRARVAISCVIIFVLWN